MSAESLSTHLQDHGLENTEFWLAEFENFGVQSIIDLKVLEGKQEILSQLSQKANFDGERKALQKILRFGKNEQELKLNDSKTPKSDIDDWKKKAESLLNEIDQLSSCKEESCHQHEVEEIECKLGNLLEIPKVWISEDRNVSELIKRIESYLQVRDMESIGTILQTCSGGRALQGILLSKFLDDQLKSRQCLLKAPTKIRWTEERLDDTMVKQFSSIPDADQFKQAIEILGHDIAAGDSFPLYGNVEINFNDTQLRKKEIEDTSLHTCSVTVKSFFTRLASYSFCQSTLELSEQAYSTLKNLLKIIKTKGEHSSEAQEECKNFFLLFGSHINLGPLTYGGYVLCTCLSEGFQESQREIVMNMQEKAVYVKPNDFFTDFNFFEDIKANFEGTIENVVSTTQLQTKIYEKLDCTSFHEWKEKLSLSKNAQVLIGRGRRLIPIWDIIKTNFKSEFGELINILQNVWENMTGFNVERDIMEISVKSECILDEISSWNMQEELTPEEIFDKLKYLLAIKREVSGQGACQQCWVRQYLTDTNLQYFLIYIMNLKVDSSTSEEIKYIMTELLNEDDLGQLNTPSFRCVSKLSNWLYPKNKKQINDPINDIVDIPTFIDFLKKKIAAVTLPKSQLPSTPLTKYVEKGIQRLRTHYYKKYEDILITILAFPFQSSNTLDVIHFKPLLQNDLVELHKIFSNEILAFENYRGNSLHLQIYLLLLAMKQHHLDYFKELMKHIISKMKELQPPIDQKLYLETNKQLHLPSLITKFKKILESHLTSSWKSFVIPSSVPDTENSRSLKNVLNHIERSKQYSSTHENICVMWDKNPKVKHLFDKIGLSDYYPKKLGLKDALCINEEILNLSISGSSLTNPHKLPFLILHKIMSYDPASLSNLMQDSSENDEENYCYVESDSENENSDEGDENDIFFDALSDFVDNVISDIHPIDALLALILCSDDFLRQDLFSRLAKCQRAIPFLILDPLSTDLTLPLWAMFSIVQDWKLMDKDKKKVDQTHQIVNYPMPIISFIRIGPNHDQVSKSKLLNDVISESESPHNYFFHRDCPGGQYNRVLGEGLIDMSWYIPNGEETDFFPDPITFLNLHGDSRQYPNQTSFLSQISSMCFVLITEKNLPRDNLAMKILENFYLCGGGMVVINAVTQSPKTLKKAFPNSIVIEQTRINSAYEIKCIIRKKINEQLKNFVAEHSLESCVRGTGLVCIDKESDLYTEGKVHASRLMTLIESHKSENHDVKEAMLPLQGQSLWRSWAFHDKELHRQIERGKETVNEYCSNMEEVKDSIRSDQLKHVDSLTPLLALFIESLLMLGQSTNKSLRHYFLQCFKLDLNALSRDGISKLQHKYQLLRKDINQTQSDSQHTESMEKRKKTLKKEMGILQEEIINSSFGLEHFFRELGQVYEADLKSHRENNGKRSCLPKAVAELLIDGYPLELMDGDAAHVPLEWVTAVLNEVVVILNDPKVFVLSVLGLQSTGKSTMLNTTFGVQFNVCAGRCTRGAYMQLLPLHENIVKKTNCSYILIVDTEGLRAPELDSDKTQKHDNELATFVIGLADTTLINIYGEIPGDMDDILQTSVHALLRMTKVRYHPSCQFVHQNAGVNVKSEVGRAKFKQKLDKYTVDAAREEHCESQYSCFNDVIEFDDQTDVHYFPGLWKGDPPMAPVNQGYSRAAQQLKQKLIQRIYKRASYSDLSLSSFNVRVSDLWNALLREKFVFSFKNTLEITAYHSLESAYSKWQWTLREAMLNWEQKAENVITTEPTETASKIVNQKLAALSTFISKEFNPIKIEKDKFFNGKQSEILIQWKAKFELRLNSLLEQLKQHAEEHCNRLLNSRQAISTFEKSRKQNAEEIKRKVQEHIENVKNEREELSNSFKSGKLGPQQIQKLLNRDLFTSEKLSVYEQKIITPEQVKCIKVIVRENGGKINENSLMKILFGETLSTSQIQSIIMKMHQTEEELKIEFEKIWIDWTCQLRVVSLPVDVEKEVEYIVTEFVKAKGYEGQLIEKINNAKLKQWGQKMDFIPKKCIHFHKTEWRIKRFLKGVSNRLFTAPDSETGFDLIQTTTQDILHEVKEYLNKMAKRETDFRTAYVLQLLNFMEKMINDKFITMKDKYSLTFEYYIDMYLIASGYAISIFEIMAKLFHEKNDPLLYLERKEKGPLFIKFKSQYAQTEAEEAIADTLCAYLEDPIKMQITKKLGHIMVTKMKSSGQHFSSKMALKVKVLCDLHSKSFDQHMAYIRDVRTYLQECLEHYTVTYCDEKIAGTNTRLQQAAKEEVSSLVRFVENFVNITNETCVDAWLDSIFKDENFRSELGEKLDSEDILRGYDSKQQLDLNGFKTKILNRLQKLTDILHQFYDSIECRKEMVYWKEKPHELLKDLMGCTEQCPFCHEQCELLDPNHLNNNEKHWTSVHRIQCVNGMSHKETGELLNGLCPSRVASDNWVFYLDEDTTHPFNKYDEIYPNWSIVPDISSQSCLFWKMFVANNADALANYYKKKKPQVEEHWKKITWKEVEENLEQVYKV